MKRVGKRNFCNIELRGLHKCFYRVTMVMMFPIVTMTVFVTALLAPERSLTLKFRIESLEIDHIDGFFQMSLSRGFRIEFASPVKKAEVHV